MLNTNLLPPHEKEAIFFEEQKRLMVFFLILLGGAFLVGFILVTPSYVLIRAEKSGLSERLGIEEGVSQKLGVKELLARVNSIKTHLALVKNRLSIPGQKSILLAKILQEAGSGVGISVFSVNEDSTVSIQGRAATRRDLLDFEKKLREGALFQDISLPLANIVRDRNIDFSLLGKLRLTVLP